VPFEPKPTGIQEVHTETKTPCVASTYRPVTDLAAAWDEFHDTKPAGWFVGQPIYIERRGWEQYAFDTRERVKAGHRSHDWTAADRRGPPRPSAIAPERLRLPEPEHQTGKLR